MLIYVGTYDFICNWVGNEKWTLEMPWSGQKAFTEAPFEEWMVEGSVAGRVRTSGNFTFATVFGAGHLVSALQCTGSHIAGVS